MDTLNLLPQCSLPPPRVRGESPRGLSDCANVVLAEYRSARHSLRLPPAACAWAVATNIVSANALTTQQ